MDIIRLTEDDMEYVAVWVKNHQKEFESNIAMHHIPFDDVLITITSGNAETGVRVKTHRFEGLPVLLNFNCTFTMNNTIYLSFKYDYVFITSRIENIKYSINSDYKAKRSLTADEQNQFAQTARATFFTLMQYINAEREIVESVQHTEVTTKTKKKKKGKRIQRRRVISLGGIRRIYEKRMQSISQKRAYTKPQYASPVRGHWRHYKSGKVVWVKPHTNYKNLPPKEGNEYKIRRK